MGALNKMEKNYNVFVSYLVELSSFLSNFVNNSFCGCNDILITFAEQKKKKVLLITVLNNYKPHNEIMEQLFFCLSLFI